MLNVKKKQCSLNFNIEKTYRRDHLYKKGFENISFYELYFCEGAYFSNYNFVKEPILIIIIL